MSNVKPISDPRVADALLQVFADMEMSGFKSGMVALVNQPDWFGKLPPCAGCEREVCICGRLRWRQARARYNLPPRGWK